MSYAVTIIGTNFNPTDAPGCPVTPVTVTTNTGSVAVSASVVSSTPIQANVTPDAADPTEVAKIIVGSSSNGGTASFNAGILGVPQIMYNGDIISGPNAPSTPTTVVVGQQIS
jgi:hypothetical protein